MFDSVGGGEIILILIAILMLFGPKRIPDLAQSLGKGLREFRKAQQELQNNLTSVTNNSDFRQLTQTFNEIKQDMHSSVQKLGADFGAAATLPALPNISTLAAPPPSDAPRSESATDESGKKNDHGSSSSTTSDSSTGTTAS
jgi:sec-independent protein translocase protein TatA